MASKGASVKKKVSIGEAVKRLKSDFSDLSISKVRYLEDEGLLKLARTPGGYRLFSELDLARLAEILRLQKEEYLPLGVIEERMRDWRPTKEKSPAPGGKKINKAAGKEGPTLLHEVLKETEIDVNVVKAMESFGLIKLIESEDGLAMSSEDKRVLTIVSDLNKFGIESRHLRMYENQAQRESMLFRQILVPQSKTKSEKLRYKGQAQLQKLIELTDEMKSLLLKKALKEVNLSS